MRKPILKPSFQPFLRGHSCRKVRISDAEDRYTRTVECCLLNTTYKLCLQVAQEHVVGTLQGKRREQPCRRVPANSCELKTRGRSNFADPIITSLTKRTLNGTLLFMVNMGYRYIIFLNLISTDLDAGSST